MGTEFLKSSKHLTQINITTSKIGLPATLLLSEAIPINAVEKEVQ